MLRRLRAVAELRPNRRRLVALVALALISAGVALLLFGRGDDEPPPVSGTPEDVVATILDFERAVADRDFATVCDRLFTADARERAGGENCPSVLARGAAQSGSPRIQIRSLVVRGDEATATVLASVPGRPASTSAIELARERGRFRIVSAGSPGDER
jgi:hypothetical protein